TAAPRRLGLLGKMSKIECINGQIERGPMYQHILIPTDGSELAHKAVTHGLSLAKSVGAKVTALVVEASFNVYDVPPSKINQVSNVFADYAERATAHAAKILGGIADEAKVAGVSCETIQTV